MCIFLSLQFPKKWFVFFFLHFLLPIQDFSKTLDSSPKTLGDPLKRCRPPNFISTAPTAQVDEGKAKALAGVVGDSFPKVLSRTRPPLKILHQLCALRRFPLQAVRRAFRPGKYRYTSGWSVSSRREVKVNSSRVRLLVQPLDNCPQCVPPQLHARLILPVA